MRIAVNYMHAPHLVHVDAAITEMIIGSLEGHSIDARTKDYVQERLALASNHLKRHWMGTEILALPDGLPDGWYVGKWLGSGAYRQAYDILDRLGNSTGYVYKVASNPDDPLHRRYHQKKYERACKMQRLEYLLTVVEHNHSEHLPEFLACADDGSWCVQEFIIPAQNIDDDHELWQVFVDTLDEVGYEYEIYSGGTLSVWHSPFEDIFEDMHDGNWGITKDGTFKVIDYTYAYDDTLLDVFWHLGIDPKEDDEAIHEMLSIAKH